MDRIFKVTLEYENIESGGGTHYTKSYTLHAKDHPDAAERGIEKLGCNRDGKLFSVLTVEIFVEA
jgi:hypothetical protein